MEKRERTAFLGYFAVLFLMVISNLTVNFDVVGMVYLVVILFCALRFILIVNKYKK